MGYIINDDNLLKLLSVIHCFGAIREIKNPEVQSEILTQAQILLTGFVLALQPLHDDEASLQQ
jgi:hypothetical protein